MKEIHISHKNSKLGADIPSLNLPPVLTCRPDAPCFAKCYARKGRFRFENVKRSMADNLDAYEADPDFFFKFVSASTRFHRFFRWHSAGDIVDGRYLAGMVQVAKENPETRYLAFTKRFDIVNAYVDNGNEIPENLRIVFSGWDENFEVDNPHNFPVNYVRFKKGCNAHVPQDAIPCGGKCYECVACWQLKKGQTVYFDEH